MEVVLLSIVVTIVVGIANPPIPHRITMKICKFLDACAPRVQVKEGLPPSKH